VKKVDYRIAWMSLTVLLCAPVSAHAQNSALPEKLSLARDSVASRFTIEAIFAQFSPEIVNAESNTSATPWDLQLPKVPGSKWPAYGDRLLRVINGRIPVASDSAIMVLRVSEMQTHGDTLVASFFIGGRSRCGKEWKGGGTYYEMRMVRVIDWWRQLGTRRAGESDSIPCRR
jgi:hypothetical protein